MNKNNFIKTLSKEIKITQKETSVIFNRILKFVIQTVKIYGILKITGFGIFKLRNIKERQIRTPDGKFFRMSKYKKISFIPSKKVKEIINTN